MVLTCVVGLLLLRRVLLLLLLRIMGLHMYLPGLRAVVYLPVRGMVRLRLMLLMRLLLLILKWVVRRLLSIVLCGRILCPSRVRLRMYRCVYVHGGLVVDLLRVLSVGVCARRAVLLLRVRVCLLGGIRRMLRGVRLVSSVRISCEDKKAKKIRYKTQT